MMGNADMHTNGSASKLLSFWQGRRRVSFILILYFLVNVTLVQGQAQMNYTIHANIIYRFTKYIDWPAEMKSGNFIIGVVGDTPLFEILNSFISTKMAGAQRIIIRRYPSSAPLFDCHILFIGEDASSSLKKIAVRTAGTSTLIVSESQGMANKGSCINFVIVNEHLQLEINKNNLVQRHLNIANELLSLGVVIQ